METFPPLAADPDFRSVVSERSLHSVIEPGVYRRVLANPFLGFLGIALWVVGLRYTMLLFEMERPAVSILILVVLLAVAIRIPRLFHFHCLDCGRTGSLRRWKEHICPAVARRLLEGRPLRFPGPRPLVQLLFWGYFLAVLLVIASFSGLTSR